MLDGRVAVDIWNSEPPSGTTIIPVWRAASSTCWRWSRRGCW
jgi:hypothetical protein